MKKLLLFFVITTLINGIIFYFRDHFQYKAYSTYADLYGECGEECRRKWGRFLAPYTEASIREARTVIKSVPTQTGATVDQVREIGHFLYSKFHNQTGTPKPAAPVPDPLAGYRLLLTDTTQKVWCGTWAQLVSFFAWSHNIVSRNVEIILPGDHHVFNECYLPEQKQWMMMDLTNNIVLATKGNQLLNGQDFVRALEHPDSVSVLTGDGTTQLLSKMQELAVIRQYYGSHFPFYYYHLTDTDAVYSTGARIKRYFLPDSWYEIFSSTPKAAILFYVKLFFIAAWVVLGSLILVKLYHDRSKRPTEKLWR